MYIYIYTYIYIYIYTHVDAFRTRAGDDGSDMHSVGGDALAEGPSCDT